MLNDDDSQYIIYYEEGQLFIIPRIFRFLQYKIKIGFMNRRTGPPLLASVTQSVQQYCMYLWFLPRFNFIPINCGCTMYM